MTFGGTVQVPVTLPTGTGPVMVMLRFEAVPVDTDGGGDPLPAVKLTAEPGAVMGGWLATINVEGMVKVTGWLAGVAPAAVTAPVTVPEMVSPTIALARVPKLNCSAKLVRVNVLPAAGAAGLSEPVTTRGPTGSDIGAPPPIDSMHVAENEGVSAPAVVVVPATKPTVLARPAPTSAVAPTSDATRTVSDRLAFI
jgi:hypothetical protein